MFEYTLIHMYTNDTLVLGTPRIYWGDAAPPRAAGALTDPQTILHLRGWAIAGPGGAWRAWAAAGRAWAP